MRATLGMYAALLVSLVLLLAACGSPPPRAEVEAPPTTVAPATVAATTPPLQPTGAATTPPRPTVITVTPHIAGGQPQEVEYTIPLTIGEHQLQAELASTREQRRVGLMWREDLPQDHGMLFVFPGEQNRGFWMQNTPLPLSIAYLDADRRILNILDMEPFDTSSYYSAGPAQYALEVHQGWFDEQGIEAGDVTVFELPADLVIE